MTWFNNLGIQIKVLAGFGVVLALTAVVAAVGIINLNSAASDTQALHDENLVAVDEAHLVLENLIAGGREQQSALLFDDPEVRASNIAKSRGNSDAAIEHAHAFRATLHSDEQGRTVGRG